MRVMGIEPSTEATREARTARRDLDRTSYEQVLQVLTEEQASRLPPPVMRDRGEDFADYLWSYVGGSPIQNRFETMRDVPASTPLSERMSKDLKKRGFRFCGPVIVYAFMQATGLVNDHLVTCPRHEPVRALAR